MTFIVLPLSVERWPSPKRTEKTRRSLLLAKSRITKAKLVTSSLTPVQRPGAEPNITPYPETSIGRWMDAEIANAIQNGISSRVSNGAHAVLVLDGAGWHHVGGQLCVPDNSTLLHLPPYAPELNPVENVWAYLRANKLSNCVFDTYESIVDACCNAWNWLAHQPKRITPIATRPWAQVSQ